MFRHLRVVSLSAVVVGLAWSGLPVVTGQTPAAAPVAGEFEGLHFRSIGPATMSRKLALIR